MTDPVSRQLLARVESGDEQAAQQLYDRYVHRLIALARGRLSNKLARRIDPEDVVQSAYRSFFARAADGHFAVTETGDLWRLMVAITLNKLRSKAKFHRARKRNMQMEDSLSAHGRDYHFDPEKIASGPTPDEAAAVAEDLERLMEDLRPVERRMLELRLQDYTLEEIAEQVERSERTVRRLMGRLRDRLNMELEDAG